MRYVLLVIILLTSFFVSGCGVTEYSNASISMEDRLNLYITEQSDKLIEQYKDSDTFSHTYSGTEVGTEGFLSKTIEYMDSQGYRVDTVKYDNNTALYFVSKTMYFYSNVNKGVTVTYRKK